MPPPISCVWQCDLPRPLQLRRHRPWQSWGKMVTQLIKPMPGTYNQVRHVNKQSRTVNLPGQARFLEFSNLHQTWWNRRLLHNGTGGHRHNCTSQHHPDSASHANRQKSSPGQACVCLAKGSTDSVWAGFTDSTAGAGGTGASSSSPASQNSHTVRASEPTLATVCTSTGVHNRPFFSQHRTGT